MTSTTPGPADGGQAPANAGTAANGGPAAAMGPGTARSEAAGLSATATGQRSPRVPRRAGYVMLAVATCLATGAGLLAATAQLARADVQVPYPTLSWTQEETIPAAKIADAARLIVENDGNVTVRVDPGATGITVTRTATDAYVSAEPLDYSVAAGTVTVRGACQPVASGFVGCQARLALTVPPGVTKDNTRVTQGWGSADVSGVTGDLIVQGAGLVTIANAGRNVTADAAGDAHISGVGGSLRLTAGGQADIHDVHGTTVVQARSVEAAGLTGPSAALSGEAGVRAVDCRTVTADSAEGEVTLVRPGPGSKATAGTGGQVRVEVPRGTITAETQDGSITIDRAPGDVAATSSDGSITVTTAEGAPAARVDARSSYGSAVVTAPQDPASQRSVTLVSHTGDVSYATDPAEAPAQ